MFVCQSVDWTKSFFDVFVHLSVFFYSLGHLSVFFFVHLTVFFFVHLSVFFYSNSGGLVVDNVQVSLTARFNGDTEAFFESHFHRLVAFQMCGAS
jgi:hypothetical protein